MSKTELAESAHLSFAPEAGRAALDSMSIVVTGHVDHGKSTVVGRLLADTGSLPEGRLETVRRMCERNAKPFEYAFLLDALKDEQAQGITIDAARVFFKSARRRYIIIDAPGHIEFLKNMITGASRAEAALLVIDAKEGVQENSRRHGYLLSMLGITQIAVIVNKMDLVGYARETFEVIVSEYQTFLNRLGVRPSCFIPVSGYHGANVARPGAELAWYQGPTVLGALDAFQSEPRPTQSPLRMPVQGVYKFTQQHDDRRIVAGTIETGRICVGEEIVFYPSGKKSRVASIEAFNRAKPHEAAAGEAIGITLTEQIYVGRGEIASNPSEARPAVSTRLRVSLFWLGKAPLVKGKDYWLKLGTARVPARVEEVHRVLDASDLSSHDAAQRIQRHEVAECTFVLGRPLAFDVAADLAPTARFVIVDNFEISGGGIVREALPDRQAWVRDKVLQRNFKWQASGVSDERRAERYSQRPTLVVVTGPPDIDRKRLARDLEARLFDDGRHVYFLGISNVLYGVDADIDRTVENRTEHLRRMGEVVNILLDAGLIVVATAVELGRADLEIIRTSVGTDRVLVAWVGEGADLEAACDLTLTSQEANDDGVSRLKTLLQDHGAIFRSW
jgi:bifunctional enzyme CysN/CysC